MLHEMSGDRDGRKVGGWRGGLAGGAPRVSERAERRGRDSGEDERDGPPAQVSGRVEGARTRMRAREGQPLLFPSRQPPPVIPECRCCDHHAPFNVGCL